MDRTDPFHPTLAAWILRGVAGVFLVSAVPSLADVENLSRYAKGLLAQREGNKIWDPENKEPALEFYGTALEQFDAIRAADPDSFTVAERTASLQLNRFKNLPAASKILRDFAKGHPAELAPQLYYSDFLRQNAPRDAMARKTAREILGAANERFPHTPNVFTRLIQLAEEAEDREGSLVLFRAEMASEENDSAAWVALIPLARNLIAGDDPEYRPTLDTLHERALRDGVSDPTIARRVSDYYREEGRLDEAIAALQKHITAVPNSLELRTRLGLLLVSAKRLDEGRQVLEDTVAIDPDFVYAHRALAGLFQKSGDLEKSRHHQSEVLRVAGGTAGDFLALANKYLEAENPHQARLLLERAQFDHPENAAVAARLAIATLRDGDTKTASRVFRQAEALAEESQDPEVKEFMGPDFQIEFARALRDAGDLASAETRLRSAARMAPEDKPAEGALALRELARLWLDQGKNQGPAISLLKRAQSLDPGNAETEALLERARKK